MRGSVNGIRWDTIYRENYRYNELHQAVEHSQSRPELLDDNSTIWKQSFRTISNYNSQEQLVETLKQRPLGTGWESVERIFYDYDPLGNLSSKVIQAWSGDGFVNFQRAMMNYDGSGNLLDSLAQVWQQDAWDRDELVSWRYDASGRIIERLQENKVATGMQPVLRSTMSYDGQGRLSDSLAQAWAGDEWFNEDRFRFSYDQQGNRNAFSWEKYVGDEWLNFVQADIEFTAAQLPAVEIQQQWKNGAWANNLRISWLYDENDRLIDYFTERWINSERTVNVDRRVYTYQRLVTGLLDQAGHQPEGSLQLFPNPARDFVRLRLDLHRLGPATLSICDLSGREHLAIGLGQRPAGAAEVKIDVGPLRPGSYVCRVQGGGEALSQKLIIMR